MASVEKVGSAAAVCPLCARDSTVPELAEAGWVSPTTVFRITAEHPGWHREDGACPACVQQVLLEALLEQGEEALHAGVQATWPLDAEAAFGALPTPIRVHAHPRYTGAGVTIAIVDAAFHPHADLTRPRNRIRAWVDAGLEPVQVHTFGPEDEPRWPGSDAGEAGQWHGLMTSAVAAGNGASSHGLYRGLAPEARVVLVQVREANGRITNAGIARALDWLRWNGPDLGVKVVNLSLGGDAPASFAANPVDEAVAAAGNDGERRLAPPATAPEALTIGGLDDKNTLDHATRAIWRSNHGQTAGGALKPELVAPSLWVVAPILPGTAVAAEARELFARRASGESGPEPRLAELRLVTPHYQHVEGTSFAAPLVAGVVACMLEANPALTPRQIRETVIAAAQAVPGAPAERQGAGALDAGRAVTLALGERHAGRMSAVSPHVADDTVEFQIHDHRAKRVSVVGSWDDWARPGLEAESVETGLWRAANPRR